MALFPNIASLDLNINRSGTLQFIQKVPIKLSNARKAPNLLAFNGRLRCDSPPNFDGYRKARTWRRGIPQLVQKYGGHLLLVKRLAVKESVGMLKWRYCFFLEILETAHLF